MTTTPFAPVANAMLAQVLMDCMLEQAKYKR